MEGIVCFLYFADRVREERAKTQKRTGHYIAMFAGVRSRCRIVFSQAEGACLPFTVAGQLSPGSLGFGVTTSKSAAAPKPS